jgi:hypothetical protein
VGDSTMTKPFDNGTSIILLEASTGRPLAAKARVGRLLAFSS